jgi:hypothetical protein
MFYNYFSDENYIPESYSKNFNAPAGVHIMNKNERRALRKLKKQTGLNEVEIRKEKKFRKILSEAQKQKGNKSIFDRLILRIVKVVTQETKLPVQHPEFKEKLNEELNRRKCWYSRGSSLLHTTSPDNIIRHYLSLRKKK